MSVKVEMIGRFNVLSYAYTDKLFMKILPTVLRIRGAGGSNLVFGFVSGDVRVNGSQRKWITN